MVTSPQDIVRFSSSSNKSGTARVGDDDSPRNVTRMPSNQFHADDSCSLPQSGTREDGFQRFPKHEASNSLNSPSSQQPISTAPLHLRWRERLKHTTWAFFTVTMATGGIANTLHVVPYQSTWLHIVGLAFFFLNIVLYFLIWAMLLTRFISFPSTFRASFTHPTESLFVPAFVVSLGTICITIVEYGAGMAGPWLVNTVLVLFWFNLVLAITLSITIYMILWTSLTFTIAQMTPIWIFPAYPLLIIGPHAANIASVLPSRTHTLQVIVGGFTVQGIGFLVSLTIYSAFVYRLMTQKLPAGPSRPGMFVSVGPAAFTCSGTIGMAQRLPYAFGGDTEANPNVFMSLPAELAAKILSLVANWMCLWLWGLAVWFFIVSVVSNLAPLYKHKVNRTLDEEKHGKDGAKIKVPVQRIPFTMTWFSYIFPQTALVTATLRLADAFNVDTLKIVGCVMAGLLIAMWLFVVFAMIRAIILKQILWPEKGEDRDEGGFVRSPSRHRKSNFSKQTIRYPRFWQHRHKKS